MKQLFRFVTSAFLLCLVALSPSSADEWNIFTPCNDVTSIAQEGDYIWWTGNTGIVRYNRLDGTYQEYTSRDYIDGYRFTASAVTPDGAKWFGFAGAYVLRLDTSGWKTFDELVQKSDQLPANVISLITCDRNGSVWFGARRGADRFDGKTWTHYGSAEGFSDKKVTAAVLDQNGNLWFGAEGNGLSRFDGDAWSRYTKEENGLPSNTVNALACDANGMLWIGTSNGLATFHNGEWKILPSLSNTDNSLENNVTALAIDREGGVWVGTEPDLVYLRGAEKTVYTSANSTLESAPDSRIRAILIDTDGILWVANGNPNTFAPRAGLARFDGKNWSRVKIPEPVGNVTWSAAVDADNVKWFATGSSVGSDPLVSFDGANWKKYTEADGLTDLWVSSIILDDSGRKWFCTRKGVTCFDGKTWKSYTAENGFPGNRALKGAIDRDGVGWFILDTGLFSFDGSTWTAWSDSVHTYGDMNGDGVVIVYCIAVDQNNVKWFGSIHDGLLSFNGKTWKHYTRADGINGDRINCITADQNNVIWLGTGLFGYDTGISRFDGKTWTNFQYDQTGIDGNIIGIAVDEANRKWFITSHYTYSVYSFDDVAWKSYSPSWGVGLGGYNCIAIDHDGEKWLGSKTMGLVTFRESDGTATRVNSSDELPKGFAFLGNRPNPFNPSTTISFSIPASGKISIVIFDITGQRVRTLLSGPMSAGTHSVVWDGRDNSGREVSSGVYFARLTMGERTAVRKMALMK